MFSEEKNIYPINASISKKNPQKSTYQAKNSRLLEFFGKFFTAEI